MGLGHTVGLVPSVDIRPAVGAAKIMAADERR